MVVVIFINIYSGDKLIKTLFYYFFPSLCVGKNTAQVELYLFFFYKFSVYMKVQRHLIKFLFDYKLSDAYA